MILTEYRHCYEMWREERLGAEDVVSTLDKFGRDKVSEKDQT